VLRPDYGQPARGTQAAIPQPSTVPAARDREYPDLEQQAMTTRIDAGRQDFDSHPFLKRRHATPADVSDGRNTTLGNGSGDASVL